MEEVKTILDNPLEVESFLNQKRMDLSNSLINISLTELLNEEKQELFKQKNRAEKFDKGFITQLQFKTFLVVFNYNMYTIKCEKKLIEYNTKKRESFDKRIEEYKNFLNQLRKGNYEVKTINQKMRILIIEEILSMLEFKINLLNAKIQKYSYAAQNIELLNFGDKNQDDEEPAFLDRDNKEEFNNSNAEMEKIINEKNYLIDELNYYKDKKKIMHILDKFNIMEMPLEYLAANDALSIYIYLETLYENNNLVVNNVKTNTIRARSQKWIRL